MLSKMGKVFDITPLYIVGLLKVAITYALCLRWFSILEFIKYIFYVCKIAGNKNGKSASCVAYGNLIAGTGRSGTARLACLAQLLLRLRLRLRLRLCRWPRCRRTSWTWRCRPARSRAEAPAPPPRGLPLSPRSSEATPRAGLCLTRPALRTLRIRPTRLRPTTSKYNYYTAPFTHCTACSFINQLLYLTTTLETYVSTFIL